VCVLTLEYKDRPKFSILQQSYKNILKDAHRMQGLILAPDSQGVSYFAANCAIAVT
jgi:hypothetical protein